MKQLLLLILIGTSVSLTTFSQETEWRNFNAKNHSIAFNMGLIQPILLKGANVEVDYRFSHLVVSYSHGWSLDLTGNTMVGDAQRQNISIHIPYSTGIGIGGSFGITKANLLIDARLEPKFHAFEVMYGSENNTVLNQVTSYHTFTLGGGVYITYLPFAKMNHLVKGLNMSMSFRYWPTIYTSMDGGKITYFNKYTNQNEIHQAANIGIANTPFIFNISIGYLFKWPAKKTVIKTNR
jgi:hypothetical protein